ncbi:MAG TPA: glycoside hydrolase family 2 protein [Terriglobales bacterium]|nr:glycoside hydrolase family 2 protein [Terriglobales bacterium]
MRFLALLLLVPALLGGQTVELHAGWMIQSSAKVATDGAEISTPGYAASGWIPAAVPSTVFNALVENKLAPDPDYGMNLRQAAGVSYKIGANFSHEEIPSDSPYAVPWWFRTEFQLPSGFAGKTVWLDFKGINYRANIWLNGHQLASAGEAQGTFRRFEYEVTSAVQAGANALAVEVFAPRVQDLAITFVDWNPMPPDKDMGLWGKVELRASGPVAIRNPWVRTRLPLPSVASAALTVAATLVNASGSEQRGTLRGRIGGHAFVKRVAIEAHGSQTIEVPVRITHPRLWWPHGMGAPALYALDLRFVDSSGKVSDRSDTEFGIDQIEAHKNEQGSEQFTINGRPLYVRGGGWTPDMLLRDDSAHGPPRWALDFRYAKELNLNTLRLEGKLMDDAFFDLADRNGILIMAGWCCCDHWEEWPKWMGDEGKVATASLRDQATRLRGHPSLLVWLNGSDNPPPAQVEQAYLEVLKEVQWPKPILSSASAKKTEITEASGVKMTGPYDYVPPVYWLEEPQLGGARGFNTETSPGAAIPPIESLKEFIPEDHLWTGTGPGQGADDPYWNFHAGSGQFLNLHRYEAALAARYGASETLADFDWKSQASAYEGERAMFEAFGRRQGEATGVIQWMFNNGWPSLIWHLYDYYLRPGGGYYGVERANEPLHIQYSDFDREITLVNHTLRPSAALRAAAAVYDLSGKRLYSHRASLESGAQSSRDGWTLPEFPGTTLLRLTLTNAAGARVSTNTYWLSEKPDVLDLKNANWFYAPESSAADFSALASMPAAQIEASGTFATSGEEEAGRVRVVNRGSTPALLVRLRVTKGESGDEVLPVWWSDNYLLLLPGEARTLTVRIRRQDLGGARPRVAVDGWNVAAHR